MVCFPFSACIFYLNENEKLSREDKEFAVAAASPQKLAYKMRAGREVVFLYVDTTFSACLHPHYAVRDGSEAAKLGTRGSAFK